LETKSLLPSLHPPGQLPARRAFQLGERPSWAGGKGGIPLFGKEGLGEISGRICLLNDGLLGNFEDFKNQYHYDHFTEKKSMLDKLQEEGFVSIQKGHLYPTPTGFAVADSLSLV